MKRELNRRNRSFYCILAARCWHGGGNHFIRWDGDALQEWAEDQSLSNGSSKLLGARAISELIADGWLERHPRARHLIRPREEA